MRSTQSSLQNQYVKAIIGYEAYRDRFQHVQRRRPQIYLDFCNRSLLRRYNHPKPLPPTLATSVLAWLLRNTSIDLVDFHLLPRTKQNILGTKRGNLRKAFTVTISKLRKFISESNLPIEIIKEPIPGRFKVKSYVGSNIGKARELAECAQHQLELGKYASAVILTEQALIIDPDCKFAVSVVQRLLGCHSVDGLYRPGVFALGCQTRDLLALINNIYRISAYKNENGLAEDIFTKARQRVVLLQQRRQKLWSWQLQSNKDVTDAYSEVLYLIGQAALAKIGTGDISYDDAFKQIINQPNISQTLHDYASAKSQKIAKEICDELELRFWRLLFIDGWLPAVATIEDFTSALQDAIRSRYRFSNTPDGAARIPGAEYRDDWYQDKKQVEEDDDPAFR